MYVCGKWSIAKTHSLLYCNNSYFFHESYHLCSVLLLLLLPLVVTAGPGQKHNSAGKITCFKNLAIWVPPLEPTLEDNERPRTPSTKLSSDWHAFRESTPDSRAHTHLRTHIYTCSHISSKTKHIETSWTCNLFLANQNIAFLPKNDWSRLNI